MPEEAGRPHTKQTGHAPSNVLVEGQGRQGYPSLGQGSLVRQGVLWEGARKQAPQGILFPCPGDNDVGEGTHGKGWLWSMRWWKHHQTTTAGRPSNQSGRGAKCTSHAART